MKFKSLKTGAIFAGMLMTGAFTIAAAGPAQALSFTFDEPQLGDPSRNNLSTTPDIAGLLPNTGDNLEISGTLQGADTDWFQFTLNQLGSLSTSFSSSHTPSTNLTSSLYLATDTTNPLQTLSFSTPGGTGGVVSGTFAAGTSFLVNIAGTELSNPDYTFNVEAQPIPTPALLPGLIGMGIAARRKRKGLATDAAQVKS